MCRALLGWRSASAVPELAIGTNEAFFVLVQGDLVDLTPGDLDPGNVDSTSAIGGYGDGPYGYYNYGQGDPTQAHLVEAASWQLDTFGSYVVGVLVPSDGRLFYWDGLASTLDEMDNAPINNMSIVVTSERFVVALGAGGDPRLIQWASQETLDVWTPSSSNTAGNYPLPGSGQIMCGRRTKNETLVFTDTDLFSMQYIGGPFIYSVVPVGRACGVLSRNAVAMVNDRAIWMGQNSFFAYDGTVRPVPSDVADYVFSSLNTDQRAKVCAVTISSFGEVWWFYPSAASVENDRYVVYNYVEDHWTTGFLSRTAGIDRSVFNNPIMASTTALYQQEAGFIDPDALGVEAPYLESGPLELGDGDRLQNLLQLIPDEATAQSQSLGALNASIYTTLYPDQAEVLNGPYTLANPTSLRLTARQIRVRVEQVTPGDWRYGILRLNTQPGSGR